MLVLDEARAGAIDALRGDLERASYTLASVERLLGPVASGAWHRGSLGPARTRLARLRDEAPTPADGAESLRLLARLFVAGESLDPEAVDRAVPRAGVSGLELLGLITEDRSGTWRASRALTPVAVADACAPNPIDWVVIADLEDHQRRARVDPEHVMGVGGASRSLIAQLPSRPVELACDIGSGCGIVSLHLSMRATRVIATDLSTRAAETTLLNARLNGRDQHIEVRCGNLFEPLGATQVDLLASNPPFVISPRVGDDVLQYRDGGLAGDELMSTMVQHAPDVLRGDGIAIMLANWEVLEGPEVGDEPVTGDRVRQWLQQRVSSAPVVDGWLIERDRLDIAAYAEHWVRDGGIRAGDGQFDDRVAAWVSDFEARGVRAVAMGVVRLSRAQARGSWRAEERPEPMARATRHPGGAFADKIDEVWHFARTIEGMSDEEMLATHWVRDPELEERRSLAPGAEAPRTIFVHVEHPYQRDIQVDAALAATLGVCDGELSLAAIADALAELWEVSSSTLRAELCLAVRELSWAGVFSPEATLER